MVKENESPSSKLGDHLAVFNSDIRMQILRILNEYQYPMEYNAIHKLLQTFCSEFVNTSYHLKRLKNLELIIGDDQGYQLTDVGARAFKKLEDLEDIVTTDRVIYVRTSKYSLEPFDETIIETNLQLEANMTQDQAQKIAHEARKRLKKANITYLTTPLIREYINAILIENQFEDYRHKLTRLGLPPYDIKQMIKSRQKANPEILRTHLGSAILEQYVLLNQMRQNFADELLAGTFVLADMEHYAISSLELILPGAAMAEVLRKYHEEEHSENPIESIFDLEFHDFLFLTIRFLEHLAPFFPKGLVIIRFDEFMSQFLTHYTDQEFSNFIKYGFYIDLRTQPWPVMLGLSLKANLIEVGHFLQIYEDNFMLKLTHTLPPFQIHHGHTKFKEIAETDDFSKLKPFHHLLIHTMHQTPMILNQFSKWGKPNAEHIFTHLHLPITFESPEEITATLIMEKISINVLKLYQENKDDEKLFFNELEKAVFHIFDYFEHKCTLLRKNLIQFPGWKKLSNWIFNGADPFTAWQNHQDYPGDFPLICGVSCHGMDEMIFMKTGLFIRDQVQNRGIIAEIMTFIDTLIQKQNNCLKSRIQYVFSHSHPQKELDRPTNRIRDAFAKKIQDQPEEIKEGYRYGFLDTHRPLSIDHMKQVYSDLVQLKRPSIVIPVSTNIISAEEPLPAYYRIIRELLSTGVCGIQSEDLK